MKASNILATISSIISQMKYTIWSIVCEASCHTVTRVTQVIRIICVNRSLRLHGSLGSFLSFSHSGISGHSVNIDNFNITTDELTDCLKNNIRIYIIQVCYAGNNTTTL